MPITYGDASYRKKREAFQIIEASGREPLREAMACALALRRARKTIALEAMAAEDSETRLKALSALSAASDAEGKSWIKIAEFVYAKPKQQIEHSGSLTLEQLLGHWDQKPENPITIGEAQ